MMQRAIILPFLLTSLYTGSAHAQQIDCTNPQDQASMNECAFRDYESADADLNDAWKIANRAMKRRDSDLPDYLKGAAKALLEGQRGWIKYRDGQCNVERSEVAGGSMAPMVNGMCLARMTRQRTKELLNIANPDR